MNKRNRLFINILFMAGVMNHKHVQLLSESVDVFNKWRKKNTSIVPDLSGADLSGLNLMGADLVRANLRGAKFQKSILVNALLNSSDLDQADFTGAQLQGAKFYRSELRGARFDNANLVGTNLKECYLIGASFQGADCTGADMKNTQLKDAVFYGAILDSTDFEGSSLSQAKVDYSALGKSIISLEMQSAVERSARKPFHISNSAIISVVLTVLLILLAVRIFQAEDPEMLETMVRARLHFVIGQFGNVIGNDGFAMKHFENVLKYSRDKEKNAIARYHIGNIYENLGEPDSACKEYKIFLQTGYGNAGMKANAKKYLETASSKIKQP